MKKRRGSGKGEKREDGPNRNAKPSLPNPSPFSPSSTSPSPLYACYTGYPNGNSCSIPSKPPVDTSFRPLNGTRSPSNGLLMKLICTNGKGDSGTKSTTPDHERCFRFPLGFCLLLYIMLAFFERFSEAKSLSIIRAFKWH